jgi:diaminopimelate decarboxylase/aspartate kinase
VRRPMLYDSYHEVYNLSRLSEPCAPGAAYQIVGPICETGDLIGRDRALPRPTPGDVIAIANAGAYGAVMSSAYNMRPAVEQAVLA